MAATDDLTAELIKFNAFLASEEDRERQARAEKKASRLREEAAATLKKVTADPKATKEEKEAAEAAWKAALATEERVKAGGPLEEPGSEPAADTGDAEDGDEAAPAVDEAPPPDEPPIEYVEDPDVTTAAEREAGTEEGGPAEAGPPPAPPEAPAADRAEFPEAGSTAPGEG